MALASPRRAPITFRSKLERRFWVDTNLPYETKKFKYVKPATHHTYTPDFHIPGTNVYIETKGRWLTSDRKKHLLIKAQHPEVRIILAFQDPSVTISKKSKTTYGDWATAHFLEWMSVEDCINFVEQYRV